MRMLEALGRGWRVLATGFCFLVFGLGGMVMRCLVYPLLSLCVRDPQRRVAWSQKIIHYSFRAFVGLMAAAQVLTYEVRGHERLRRRGLLVLANHPSLIDVVFLISLIRHMDCIVKDALVRNAFTRGPIMAAGFIANNAGAGLVADCMRSLGAGNNLIIFPEGTRTPLHGPPVRLQRGAANVAVRGGFDITPVHIHCTLPMLTKGTPWWQVPQRRPHFTIEVREDIAIAPFVAQAASEALAARAVTEHLSDQLFKKASRVST
nr:lysophospholipid acyltransferase family protein [Acidovorax sp. Be4]